MKSSAIKPKMPRGRRKAKADKAEHSQATSKDFEREDMGVAPKE